MDQVASHDGGHPPPGVYGGGVQEEDGDSIAGQQPHESVQNQVRRGKARPDGKGFGGGPFDQEEGVGEVVPEPLQLVGEEEVAFFGEEVVVEFGEVGLALDAPGGGGLGEDVVAGGQAAREGVKVDGATGGGPRDGATGDGEVGGEDEGGLLPVVDEDEVVSFQGNQVVGIRTRTRRITTSSAGRYTTDLGAGLSRRSTLLRCPPPGRRAMRHLTCREPSCEGEAGTTTRSAVGSAHEERALRIFFLRARREG